MAKNDQKSGIYKLIKWGSKIVKNGAQNDPSKFA
jgi:hypothetical protein